MTIYREDELGWKDIEIKKKSEKDLDKLPKTRPELFSYTLNLIGCTFVMALVWAGIAFILTGFVCIVTGIIQDWSRATMNEYLSTMWLWLYFSGVGILVIMLLSDLHTTVRENNRKKKRLFNKNVNDFVEDCRKKVS